MRARPPILHIGPPVLALTAAAAGVLAASPTVEGLRAGRDEGLERGLAVIPTAAPEREAVE